MPDRQIGRTFELFNEIGIIAQLGRALFEARLPDGVLLSHFTVLNHLLRVSDGRTPVELARAFQVPKATMTHTLSGLERRGWIAVRPNPADRRSKLIWITEAGRDFRDGAIARLAPDLAAAADEVMPQETVDALLPALRDLRTWLDARRVPDPRAAEKPLIDPDR